MAEFEGLLQDYKLEPSHAADLGDDCITIDVDHLTRTLPDLENAEQLKHVQSATKLYVCGTWSSYFQPEPPQWRKDVEKICGLIRSMTNLDEVTWMSDLPFMEIVWEALPKTIAKLIVDISRPVGVDQLNPLHKKYLCQEGMRPLVAFTKLRELRVFGMHDTCQSIIWETVFRNEADEKGMHVLDLQMAEKPLVRQQHWVKAEDVQGLKVSNVDGRTYRGIDGRGVLHYEYGTGEYLDDYCMRKARIASNLEDAKPLPLWCFKLDGFVVDRLPFEHELSKVVLLTCGKNCIDAGLRAPQTSRAYTLNKWGPSVNNEATHCLVVFPNWAVIFDNEGRPLDPSGNVIDDDDTVRSPPPSESVPLTAEHLSLKNLTEALESVKQRGSRAASPMLTPVARGSIASESSARVEIASVTAEHGSTMPSPGVKSPVLQSAKDQVPAADIRTFGLSAKLDGILRLSEVEVDTVSSGTNGSPTDLTDSDGT